jgi:glucose/arabinose dehydrogenase
MRSNGPSKHGWLGWLTTTALLFSTVGAAQQKVPFRNNIPVAPQGIKIPPLPEKPVEFQTAEGQDIQVVVVAKGLAHPWSLAFLPDGTMLITERPGRLRTVRNGVLDPQEVAGVPAVRAVGLSGLMDVALHPKFAENHFVYLTYTKPIGNDQGTVALARGVWNGTALTDVRDIFVAAGGSGGASRIAFGHDGTLYLTAGGGGGSGAQDPNSHAGKVLRLRDDGTVPSDNPFVGKPGARPEIYTIGHRDHHGIAAYPPDGRIFEAELGPLGGDKINILAPGRNYGWPNYGYGRDNDGSPMEHPNREGIEPSWITWNPGITPSGLLFYTGDKFPDWKGNMFVGSIQRGRIPGTGALERVVFNDKLWELRRETILQDFHQRIRDVRQGPDGLIYLLTEEDDGAVLKIEPVK